MRPVSHSLVTLSVSLLMLLQVSAALATTLYVSCGNKKTGLTARLPNLAIRSGPQCLPLLLATQFASIHINAGAKCSHTGNITISKNLTIEGVFWFQEVTLVPSTAQPKDVVFVISKGAHVTLSNLMITGGTFGGVQNSGGNLTLSNVLLTKNTGGATVSNFDHGYLKMQHVQIEGNSGTSGLQNDGLAQLFDTAVEGMGGPSGVGITNTNDLTINRGLIAGNQRTGLLRRSYTSPPTTNCSAAALLINVTISGNQDSGIAADCGKLHLVHVTVAANNKTYYKASGLALGNSVNVLENSIVANNSGKQCGFYVYTTGFNPTGPNNTIGALIENMQVSYSLLGDYSCVVWPLGPPGQPGDLVGVDPKLSALAYPAGSSTIFKALHLGAKRVHALQPGSPAIDSAGDIYCTNNLVGAENPDQVGVQRPIDGDGDGAFHCDMGASEYKPSQ